MDYQEVLLQTLYDLKKGNEELISSNERHQEFLDELKELGSIEFESTLFEDVIQNYFDLSQIDVPHRRRNCIKAVFSYLEGCLASLKREILLEEKYRTKKVLSAEEIMLLEERMPHCNAKGKIKTVPKFVDFFGNIRLTFLAASKLIGFPFQLDTASQEWAFLKESHRVRNRITHPKEKADLEISDSELVKAYFSFKWFRACLKDFIVKKSKHLEMKLANKKPGDVIF